MANVFANLDMVTAEALRLLRNNTEMAGLIPRPYEAKFGKDGMQIGDTLRIRKLPKFTVRDGATMSTVDDISESTDTLMINKRKHVGFKVSRQQATLNLDNFSKHVLEPAVAELANYVDWDILSTYKQIGNQVGTIGTTPATTAVILASGVKLHDGNTPKKGRALLLNPDAEAAVVETFKGNFNPQGDIAKQVKSASMGRNMLGYDFYSSQNINVHTTGLLGGTPLVDGAQTGASILTKGWSNSVTGLLKEGDVIQFANCFAVNWFNKQSTGKLLDCVVTADVNSSGAGAATIPIKVWPSAGPAAGLVTSGPYQNCVVGAANNAAITVFGIAQAGQAAIAGKTSPQNMGFHPEAFAFAAVPLDRSMCEGAKVSTITDPDVGLSLSLALQWNIDTDETRCRLDILYGYKVLRGELACRLIG